MLNGSRSSAASSAQPPSRTRQSTDKSLKPFILRVLNPSFGMAETRAAFIARSMRPGERPRREKLRTTRKQELRSVFFGYDVGAAQFFGESAGFCLTPEASASKF